MDVCTTLVRMNSRRRELAWRDDIPRDPNSREFRVNTAEIPFYPAFAAHRHPAPPRFP